VATFTSGGIQKWRHLKVAAFKSVLRDLSFIFANSSFRKLIRELFAKSYPPRTPSVCSRIEILANSREILGKFVGLQNYGLFANVREIFRLFAQISPTISLVQQTNIATKHLIEKNQFPPSGPDQRCANWMGSSVDLEMSSVNTNKAEQKAQKGQKRPIKGPKGLFLD
jgi:hypothetical protein